MLFRVAEKRVEEGKEAKVDSASLAVLVARVGATDQKIVTSTIEEGRLCYCVPPRNKSLSFFPQVGRYGRAFAFDGATWKLPLS